jgi:hypothetical protein
MKREVGENNVYEKEKLRKYISPLLIIPDEIYQKEKK